MKVLQCIPNLSGGGAERQFCLLARGLAEKGVEVHVAFAAGGPNDKLLIGSACHVHHILSNSSYDPKILLQLHSLITDISPDIVQTWLPQMDVAAGLCAIANCRPLVLCERSNPTAYPLSFRVVARRAVGRFATAVVANSATGLAYWNKINKSAESRVIHNGISDDPLEILPGTPYRNGPLEASSRPLILFVGRYDRDKQVLTTAKATIAILSRLQEADALFLGDGALRDQLVSLVREARLEHRFIIGPFASNARAWMKRASVLVSLSDYEGHPNAVLEAALASVPVVLSDIAPHREFLDDDDALFVDQTNEAAVVEGIARALADPESALKRVASAQLKVQKFSVDSMVSAYRKLYADLVEDGRS